MTYPFKFAGQPEPTVTISAVRDWGGFSARRGRAGAGRHDGVVLPDHRVVFYACDPTRTECGADGTRQRRMSAHGDFDFVPAGCDGFWEDSAPVDLVSIRFTPELMAQVAEGLGLARAGLTLRLGGRDPIVSHMVAAFGAELTAPPAAGRLSADCLATALAVRLLQESAPPSSAAIQTLSKPKLRRLIDYIEAHLDADLGLAELAAVAGLSIPHLTALFRRTMGQSLHRYVVERRVLRARDLLLGGERSIAQVALTVGFAHQSHLARWMRRTLGATPGAVLAAAG